MATARLAELRAKARAVGVRVTVRRDREGLEHEVLLDAPDGTVFADSEVHQLVHSGADGESLEALVVDALERLAYGIVDCPEEDCDVCALHRARAADRLQPSSYRK